MSDQPCVPHPADCGPQRTTAHYLITTYLGAVQLRTVAGTEEQHACCAASSRRPHGARPTAGGIALPYRARAPRRTALSPPSPPPQLVAAVGQRQAGQGVRNPTTTATEGPPSCQHDTGVTRVPSGDRASCMPCDTPTPTPDHLAWLGSDVAASPSMHHCWQWQSGRGHVRVKLVCQPPGWPGAESKAGRLLFGSCTVGQ